MNLRIHVVVAAAFLVLCLATVDSSIENSPASSAKVGSSLKLKASDDLYIDDEGDDEIQLGDEASGAGPLNKSSRVDEDEDEEEEEEEEEDEEDDSPVVEKPKEVAPPSVTGSKSSDLKEDEVVAPPKVSPVAAPPSRVNPPISVDDDDEDDEDFEVQGSGDVEGSGSGKVSGGAGSTSGGDDDVEDEYDDTDDVEDFDVTSVITEPEPKTPVKPERKPDVVVVAPPTTPAKTPEMGPTPSPSTTQPPPPAPPVQQPEPTSPPEVGSSDVHIHDHKPEDRQASFFAQPGILAAVIGGAVVGLLCAILLVMFIVYRMRKKDEGSYVLDEPKRSSPSSHPYNKNSREFYA